MNFLNKNKDYSQSKNMKKIFLFVLSLFLIFSVSACSNVSEKKQDSESEVLSLLSSTENIDILHDETIKALSVICRTQVEGNCSMLKTKNKTTNPERIKNLANQTKGECLILKDISPKNLFVFNGEKTWNIEIKKSKLLEFLNKKNISLANLTNISSDYDEEKNLKSITLGGKTLSFDDLKNEFGLISSKITKITPTLSSIIVEGEVQKTIGFFDITEAEDLAKSGKDYKQLLNHFYN